MSEIALRLGPMSKPIAEQLYQQGYKFRDAKDEMRASTARDYIAYLSVGGLLSDTETHKARERLFKMIMQTIEPTSPTPVTP